MKHNDEEKLDLQERELYINGDFKTEGTKNFKALNQSDLPEALVYFL